MLSEVKLDSIIPKGDRVLVDIYIPPEQTDSGIVLSGNDRLTSTKMDIHNYAATVVAIGDKKEVHQDNPGLKPGDKVLFSQFAGYHVPAEKGVFAKVVHSHDIHAKIKRIMKFKNDEVIPTNDRLVVKEMILGEDIGDGKVKLDSGIIIDQEAARAGEDPAEVDSIKTEVIAVGPKAKDYVVGDIVYIPTYVGNVIVTASGDFIKTINYKDVLFKVQLN